MSSKRSVFLFWSCFREWENLWVPFHLHPHTPLLCIQCIYDEFYNKSIAKIDCVFPVCFILFILDFLVLINWMHYSYIIPSFVYQKFSVVSVQTFKSSDWGVIIKKIIIIIKHFFLRKQNCMMTAFSSSCLSQEPVQRQAHAPCAKA